MCVHVCSLVWCSVCSIVLGIIHARQILNFLAISAAIEVSFHIRGDITNTKTQNLKGIVRVKNKLGVYKITAGQSEHLIYL